MSVRSTYLVSLPAAAPAPVHAAPAPATPATPTAHAAAATVSATPTATAATASPKAAPDRLHRRSRHTEQHTRSEPPTLHHARPNSAKPLDTRETATCGLFPVKCLKTT